MMARLETQNLRAPVELDVESSEWGVDRGGAGVAWPRLSEHGNARSSASGTAISSAEPKVRPTRVTSRKDAADDASVDQGEGGLAELSRIRAQIVGDLYRSSYHRVFCFARRLVGEVEAEEVAHEAFVRLLRVRNLERMNISVAYLLRIAENLIRRKHGRVQRFREVLERSGRMVLGIEQAVAWPESAARPEARVGSLCIDSDCIEGVLHRLSPSEQSAVRLIVCEGLDYQAAACSLGVPVSTINNWKHRALGKLKQIIEGERLSKPRERLSAG